eukprot:gene14008-14126_t
MTRWRADMLLLLTALIWGTAFVAQKIANQSMGPATFVGVRFLVSSVAIAPFMLHESRGQVTVLHRRDWMIAATIGLCLFFGAMLQQVGMLTTTATNAGFLTALYVVCVPFAVWSLTRERPKTLVVLACAISVLGAYLLTDNGEAKSWAIGDVMMLIADLAWALGIALFAVTGTLALMCGLIFEDQNLKAVLSVWPAILYTAIISGSLAYTMQIVAQKYAPAAEAALILSLESVFAAIAGAILLNERLSLLATLGCALILLGVILVEVGPSLLKGRPVNELP